MSRHSVRRSEASIAAQYFEYLQTVGHECLSSVTCEDATRFIRGMAKRCKPRTVEDAAGALMKIHNFLRTEGLCQTVLAIPFIKPKSPPHVVRVPFPVYDAEAVVNQINTGEPEGKRDYAILLTAVYTGLRACDIASLRLDNIDWKRGELSIVQGKTGRQLTLPLHDRLTSAIADYILNARPKSDSPHIFLRTKAPFQRLQDGVSVAGVLRRRMKDAGVAHKTGDEHTFHGLRRMLATKMVEEEVPLETVSQVLGHSSLKSAKPYISLDVRRLRNCVLEPASLEMSAL
jgi:integrase